MVFNRAGAAGVDGGVLGSHGGDDERELDLGLGLGLRSVGKGLRSERGEQVGSQGSLNPKGHGSTRGQVWRASMATVARTVATG